MGLLNKALVRGKEEKPSPVLNEDKYNLTSRHSLVRHAEKYNKSIYSMVNIFGHIEKYFDKGSLLLKVSSQSDTLYPAATKGFDKTTFNRLRLNILGIDLESCYPYKLILKNEAEDFRRIFSTREFDMIENILVFPLKNSKDIFGCLLMINIDENEIIKIDSLIIQDKESYDVRYRLIPVKPYIFSSNDKFKDDIRKIIEDKNEKVFHLFDIDFSDYFALIETKYKFIQRPFVRHDIIQVLSNLFEANGTVYSCSNNRIVIIFQSNTISSSQLISHQIIISVKDILPYFDDGQLSIEYFKFPEQEEILREKYK